MEVWSCGCRASVGLPDLAAPVGACALPLPQLLWDSPEFPHAPGATVLSVQLLGVFQRSGPFLIPPECKLGHPLHPIQSKPNSGWGKKAKYRAKNNLPKSIYSGADTTFLYPSQPLYGETSYMLRNPCDKSQHTYHESTAPLSCRANLSLFCLLSYQLQNNEVAGSERVNLGT